MVIYCKASRTPAAGFFLAVLVALTGGQHALQAQSNESLMTPLERVLAVNNALWNDRDLSILDEHVDPELDYSTPYSTQSGREGLRADARQYYDWAESNTSTFTAYAMSGKDVFVRWQSESKPRGSARLYNSKGIDYYRVEDGRITAWKTAHEVDSTASNKKIVGAIIKELWNDRDLEAVDRYFAPSVVVIYENDISKGVEGITAGAQAFFSGWAKSNTRITHLVAEADTVFIRWESTATHTGEYMGIQATGKTLTYSGSDLYRILDGKVVETATFWDRARVMEALTQSD